MAQRVKTDWILFFTILIMVAFGLVMVYSASAVAAQNKLGDGLYYLKRQLMAAGVGVATLIFFLKLGYKRLAPLTYPALVGTFGLLIAVLIPHIGFSAGGAQRWISFPGISIQPAEIAKLALVLYLAYSLAKKRDKVKLFSIGFLPHCFVAGAMVLLCLREPDFGTSVALVLVLGNFHLYDRTAPPEGQTATATCDRFNQVDQPAGTPRVVDEQGHSNETTICVPYEGDTIYFDMRDLLVGTPVRAGYRARLQIHDAPPRKDQRFGDHAPGFAALPGVRHQQNDRIMLAADQIGRQAHAAKALIFDDRQACSLGGCGAACIAAPATLPQGAASAVQARKPASR